MNENEPSESALLNRDALVNEIEVALPVPRERSISVGESLQSHPLLSSDESAGSPLMQTGEKSSYYTWRASKTYQYYFEEGQVAVNELSLLLSGNSKAEEEVFFDVSQKGNLKIRSTYLASTEKGPVTPLCQGKTIQERQRLVETWNYERETGKLTVESRQVVMKSQPVQSLPFASISVSPKEIKIEPLLFLLSLVALYFLSMKTIKKLVFFFSKTRSKGK